MITLIEKHGLIFAELTIRFRGKEQKINNVLIDTGSGGTILKSDLVFEVGVEMEPTDSIETIRGVGGSEFVFQRKLTSLI